MLSDFFRRQVYEGGIQERRELAIHESAHATITALSIEPHLSGSLLLGVSIERTLEAVGWVDGRSSSRPGGRPLALRAMAFVAGPVAEYETARGYGALRVCPLLAATARQMPGSQADWQTFDEVARFLARDHGRPVAEVQAALMQAAEQAVRQHRPAIDRLADVLLERGWLSGKEAASIIRAVEPRVVLVAPDLTGRATTRETPTVQNAAGSGRRETAAEMIRRGEEAVAALAAAKKARQAKAARMPSPMSYPEWLSVHESAHAAAAWLLHIPIRALLSEAKSGGRLEWGNPPSPERAAICYAAGPLAEADARRRTEPGVKTTFDGDAIAPGDRRFFEQQLDAIAAEFPVTSRQGKREREIAPGIMDVARRMVRAPKFTAAVEALAKVMLHRGRLEGPAVEGILAEHLRPGELADVPAWSQAERKFRTRRARAAVA